MAQVSRIPLRKQVHDEITDLFTATLADITDKRLLRDFLDDFLTPTEKIVLAKRLAVYVLLAKGYQYNAIRSVLNISPPTIASVSVKYHYIGKAAHHVIDKLVASKRFEKTLLQIAEKIMHEFALTGRSALWKATHRAIKSKLQKEL